MYVLNNIFLTICSYYLASLGWRSCRGVTICEKFDSDSRQRQMGDSLLFLLRAYSIAFLTPRVVSPLISYLCSCLVRAKYFCSDLVGGWHWRKKVNIATRTRRVERPFFILVVCGGTYGLFYLYFYFYCYLSWASVQDRSFDVGHDTLTICRR